MRKRIQAIALVALLVASLAAFSFPVSAGSGAAASSAVTFSDQTSGGYTVTVDSVTLPEGGFVTIHDASVTEEHVLGSVVGSSQYLAPGTYENVTIRLDEPLDESGTYVAMPHKDTNGNHIYEFVSANGQADGPYVSGGKAVVDTAKITVSATVTMTDQPTDGWWIVIDRVELSQPGFVAVHDSTLLQGEVTGSVVGHSTYLSAGVHENVRIKLDEAVANETLIPMPHKDTNDNKEYDFVTSGGSADGPFLTAEGKAVLDTATVTKQTTSSVSISDQTTGGTVVVIDSVFVPEGGFIALHDGTLLDGAVLESVRGHSEYLKPGLHRNVVFTLDEPYEGDGTLIPMPHKDSNDNQQYDFVTSDGSADGPYTKDGKAVVASANLTVSASVTLNTQESAGHTIVIETVDLAKGGFVTIHDSSLFAGNVVGSVVGTSAYLSAGVHHDVKITLSTPVNESQTLVAMAHKDTNDNQAYDFVEQQGGADGPYTANGKAVVDTGKALVTGSVWIADQSSMDGETVVVRSVTLANGGFVTIHDSSLLDGEVFGSVRGTSEYLAPGTHHNVTITLDEPLEGDVTVFAMAHADTNGNEAYDFVTSEGASDGPYVAAGAPVMQSASISAPTPTTTTTTTEAPPMTTTTEAPPMTETPTTEAPSPGFGIAIGMIAVLGAALLALRKE